MGAKESKGEHRSAVGEGLGGKAEQMRAKELVGGVAVANESKGEPWGRSGGTRE